MASDYYRIETTIRYLENNFQAQPSLEELAAYLKLSPFHFQRLFRRWAGISLKRFLQFLTLSYAKQLLKDSRSVLDAGYAAGLSGPGRLHDLFVTFDAVTPGEFKNQGFDLRISYGFHPSPFGRCLLALTDRGICALAFLDSTELDAALDRLQKSWPMAVLTPDTGSTGLLVKRIFSEPDSRQPLNLLVKGTNFQIKVWEALLRIPSGCVCSYEDIASRIGRSGAARAVGAAVGSNPVAWMIPCHRVIRKSGHTGGYRWGTARKKAMLDWEAAKNYDQQP